MAVEHHQEALGIPLHLPLIKLAVAIEIGICAVDHAEHLLHISPFADVPFAAEVTQTEAVALLCNLCYAEVLGVVGLMFSLGNEHLALHPTCLFLEAELSHVLRVVGIVIDGVERRELVVAVGEHALGVEVGEAQRPHYLRHTSFLPPFLDCLEQCSAHFQVVDEVDPTKANLSPAPFLVGTRIDDGCHTAYDATFLASQEESCLAKVESRIAAGIERLERVFEHIRHSQRTVLIQLVVEADECPHLLGRANLTDCYCAHTRFHLPIRHINRAKIIFFTENLALFDAKLCEKQLFLFFNDLKDIKDIKDSKEKTSPA